MMQTLLAAAQQERYLIIAIGQYIKMSVGDRIHCTLISQA
jgi:hypothetical protein